MARLGRSAFLAIAVIFHLSYVFSIFDIYFVSPIVSGMRPFAVDSKSPPAKRLVLFVGDGLRADKAFQYFPDPSPATNSSEALIPRPLAPFLRSRVLEHGTFGVSHTRVPTESRPGHVALIAGLYEDVSSVTTGWTTNPVNFDSVFNRSRHTWSWGSPDILPMFEQGAVPGRVDSYMYPAHAEDFSADATYLDIWVFDQVKAFFDSARTNATLNKELRRDKVVFFLHLLGLDTTGHAKRPYSKEYLHNIKVVDKGVQEITQLIQNFYGDEETAFVFTADHGMSDWGSHGDGHPDNTRTPLIAWGSGVARPRIVKEDVAPGHEDGFSSDWGLDHVQRHDVAQADIAALMAYLAGLAFPVNSVGELPLSYLAATPTEKAHAMLANANGILEMYRVKEEQKAAKELRFKPFGPLSEGDSTPQHRISLIEEAISGGDVEDAIQKSMNLIKLGIDGLRYLQTYDWLFLRTLVTAGYLGWIAFATTTVIDMHVLHGKAEESRTVGSLMAFSSLFILLCSFLAVQGARWTYYLYAVFPVVFWEETFARRKAILKGGSVLLGNMESTGSYFLLAFKTFAFVGLLEALVQSYFFREVYTVCYFLGISWPLMYGAEFIDVNFPLVATWGFCCMVMSLFTLLPAIKSESMLLIMLGGGLMLIAGMVYLSYAAQRSTKPEQGSSQDTRFSRKILGAQVGLVALAMIVTHSSVTSLQAGEGLPLGTQVVGWAVLALSLGAPFLHRLQQNDDWLHRLAVLFLTFAPSFIILTISYEGLFYFFYSFTLLTWVRLEHRIYQYSSTRMILEEEVEKQDDKNTSTGAELNPLKPVIAATKERLAAMRKGNYRSLTLADARISLFFFFLLQSAFFSTGNIASVSSFSMDSVYRLIPVFDPFSQGALLVLKLMIPFALISANLGILNRRIGVAPSALFMIVMAISDVMTLNFFYMVKDEGSWLDIGTTISHFCIASLLCVFVAGLEFVSEIFVKGVEFNDDEVESDDVVKKLTQVNGISSGSGSSAWRTGIGQSRPSPWASGGRATTGTDYMGRRIR